jgi:hypothetical protein
MLAGCVDVFGLTAKRLPAPAQIALRRAVRRRHRAVVDAPWPVPAVGLGRVGVS